MTRFWWFWYWALTGRPHPDQVAECARQWREWETEVGRWLERREQERKFYDGR